MPPRQKAKAKAKAKPKPKPKARAKPSVKRSAARVKKLTSVSIRPSMGPAAGGVVHRALHRLNTDKRTLAVRSFNRIVPPGGKATTVPGLLKPLRKVFFPPVKLPGNRAKKWRPMSRVKPTLRGIRVHRELELWAKCEWPTGKRAHKYTVAIIDAMNAKGIRPVAPEPPIVSRAGYLTHIDLLCWRRRFDGKQELWVISYKTGYDRNVIRHSQQCHGACGILGNSDQNFHILQIACEIYCLRHEYNFDVAGGMIIYAGFGTGEQTVTVDLPAWAHSERFMRSVHDELREKTDPDTRDIFDAVIATTATHVDTGDASGAGSAPSERSGGSVRDDANSGGGD